MHQRCLFNGKILNREKDLANYMLKEQHNMCTFVAGAKPNHFNLITNLVYIVFFDERSVSCKKHRERQIHTNFYNVKHHRRNGKTGRWLGRQKQKIH